MNTADSVWAFELGQRAGEIAERLGVGAVRFAPGPLAGREAAAPAVPVPVPSLEELREAARIADAIEDPELRKSVEKAVSLGLASISVDRPL